MRETKHCITTPIQLLLLGGVSLLAACGGGSGAGDGQSVRSSDRPNIIFVFTDDHGYADIGAQHILSDVKTPHIDQLAATGVRMTDGYITAPQCTPSRSALLTGRYQQKFGVDDNSYSPFPLEQPMLAERLAAVGYKTGIAGKWHLDINGQSERWYNEVYAPGSSDPFRLENIPLEEKLKYYPENRGFQDGFVGYYTNYRANYAANGQALGSHQNIKDAGFRVDVISDAAVSFIDRHKTDPFFLYVAYYAPHVPLEATDKYLSRFPGTMPERRRYALAMLSAVDDGVGRIMQRLESYGIDDDTLIVFMSDNGAPLALTKADVSPVSTNGPEWDGSLNDPWVGEKGMLSEAGIRVPYIVKWKGHLPEGLVYKEPVISIDASTTAAAAAGLDISGMDGVNLVPYLKNPASKPNRALFWRFMQQSAIRKGNWKYLRTADEGEYLFDLSSDQHEKRNLLTTNPALAASLHQELAQWSTTLKTPGLPTGSLVQPDKRWFDYYFPAGQ